MRFPEIEHGLLSSDYRQRLQALEATSTDIDLLEITHPPSSAVKWQQGMNHTDIVTLFQEDASLTRDIQPPALRILFLNSNVDERMDFYSLKIHPSSLQWLQARFQVPLIFLESVVNISKWAKIGSGCFLRHSEGEQVIGIDTLYRVGRKGGSSHVWASHCVTTKCTTYIISNCSPEAKNRIVSCAQGPRVKDFYRPLFVDMFLAEVCLLQHKKELSEARRYLVSFEYYGTSRRSSESETESFQSLHRLSQTWHILHDDLIDLEEIMIFLYETCVKFNKAHGGKPEVDTADSIAFLASQMRIWRRWVANYNTRTNNRINLFYNLANQKDNRINIEIARLTKDIAQEARKDSSSMITIAVLTMLFLPGTFVSAVFSMAFFYGVDDKQGRTKLAVMPQWWYFLASTVSLTVLVFLTWIIWQRWKDPTSNNARPGKRTKILNATLQANGLPLNDNSPFQLEGMPNLPRIDSTSYHGPYFYPTSGTVDNKLMYQF